jgi:hypothetical protein
MPGDPLSIIGGNSSLVDLTGTRVRTDTEDFEAWFSPSIFVRFFELPLSNEEASRRMDAVRGHLSENHVVYDAFPEGDSRPNRCNSNCSGGAVAGSGFSLPGVEAPGFFLGDRVAGRLDDALRPRIDVEINPENVPPGGMPEPRQRFKR